MSDDVTVYVGDDVTVVEATSDEVIIDGIVGPPGPGVPVGGTTGQVLAKASAADRDTEWVAQTGGGGAVASVNGRTGVVVGLAEQADLATEASTRAAADTALDGRLDTLEAISIATDAELAAAVAAHEADTTGVHGIPDTAALATTAAVAAGYQPLDGDLTALATAGNGTVLAATTASFTTADESKLDGIEAAADVTDAANVAAAGAVMSTLVDVKGDLIVGSAADTVTRLAVGTDTHVLTADSTQPAGVKWAAAAASGGTTLGLTYAVGAHAFNS
jgi:hypothetical protein